MLNPTPSASRGQHTADPDYRDVENLRRSISAMNAALNIDSFISFTIRIGSYADIIA